jgi:hypothetical protein
VQKLVLAFVVATLTASSIAAARPNTTTMTCAQAAATVSRAGAITLSTGKNTYERYVASISQCLPRQTTQAGIAPTRDNPRCQVGLLCRRPDWFNDNK